MSLDDLASKFQASLSNCLLDNSTWMSNLTCPKLSTWNSSLQPLLPAEIPILVVAPSFQLLRTFESFFSLLSLSSTFDRSQNPSWLKIYPEFDRVTPFALLPLRSTFPSRLPWIIKAAF